MAEIPRNNILSDATVREAMRVQLFTLPPAAGISHGIRHLIKYKINAFLVRQEDGTPVGVVSKTDIVGAYYAGLPLESPLNHIMVSPPIFCSPQDSLESALDTMRDQRIYRLYVLDEEKNTVVGALAYPDIVGLLYGYCRNCIRSLANRRSDLPETSDGIRIRVKDVMTERVNWFYDEDSLVRIMEGLSEHRHGAVLVKNSEKIPVSVVSKTDLILAYAHGISPESPCRGILAASRVISCPEDAFLEDAIRKMILTDLQRLFVWKDAMENVVGVITLSDAARVRSGSCHACTSSRIKVE